MEKTILSQTIKSLMICVSAGAALSACGGGGNPEGGSSGSTQLLADGEACATAWSAATTYSTSGIKVSRNGRNYTSAMWTLNQDPATNSGATGSGQPWVTGYLCGSTPTPTPAPTPTPTPTPAPTPTPTPAPTPTPTPAGFGSLVSSAQFDTMFPPSGRNSFYTYAGLVAAANSISGFTTTGSTTVQKQEAAAFLANVAHETGRLQYVVEQNTANYGSYCDMSQSYGCPAGTAAYYGRGPLQLSWNFNYKAAGDYLSINLLSSPGLVASDATITWKSALWYWMSQNGPNTMTAHSAMVNSAGFGQTIKSINGSLECNGNNTAQMQDRINYYNSFTSTLGVAAGSNLSC